MKKLEEYLALKANAKFDLLHRKDKKRAHNKLELELLRFDLLSSVSHMESARQLTVLSPLAYAVNATVEFFEAGAR
jgi:hypothetical protein